MALKRTYSQFNIFIPNRTPEEQHYNYTVLTLLGKLKSDKQKYRALAYDWNHLYERVTYVASREGDHISPLGLELVTEMGQLHDEYNNMKIRRKYAKASLRDLCTDVLL